MMPGAEKPPLACQLPMAACSIGRHGFNRAHVSGLRQESASSHSTASAMSIICDLLGSGGDTHVGVDVNRHAVDSRLQCTMRSERNAVGLIAVGRLGKG